MNVVPLCTVSSGLDDDDSKNVDSSAGKDIVQPLDVRRTPSSLLLCFTF